MYELYLLAGIAIIAYSVIGIFLAFQADSSPLSFIGFIMGISLVGLSVIFIHSTVETPPQSPESRMISVAVMVI